MFTFRKITRCTCAINIWPSCIISILNVNVINCNGFVPTQYFKIKTGKPENIWLLYGKTYDYINILSWLTNSENSISSQEMNVSAQETLGMINSIWPCNGESFSSSPGFDLPQTTNIMISSCVSHKRPRSHPPAIVISECFAVKYFWMDPEAPAKYMYVSKI